MSLRMGASEAGFKVWDWSMGSLEVALDREDSFITQDRNDNF